MYRKMTDPKYCTYKNESNASTETLRCTGGVSLHKKRAALFRNKGWPVVNISQLSVPNIIMDSQRIACWLKPINTKQWDKMGQREERKLCTELNTPRTIVVCEFQSIANFAAESIKFYRAIAKILSPEQVPTATHFSASGPKGTCMLIIASQYEVYCAIRWEQSKYSWVYR